MKVCRSGVSRLEKLPGLYNKDVVSLKIPKIKDENKTNKSK